MFVYGERGKKEESHEKMETRMNPELGRVLGNCALLGQTGLSHAGRPVIQRIYPMYSCLAEERCKKIYAIRNMQQGTMVQILADINTDTDNSGYQIPGKRPNQQFDSCDTLYNHIEEYYRQNPSRSESDLDLGNLQNGFSQEKQRVYPLLTRALQKVFYQGHREEEDWKDHYKFNTRRFGYNLASEIIPGIVKGKDYRAGARFVGATTREEADDGFINIVQTGLGTGRKQKVHEVGHVLENQMGVGDFLNVHRFLRARSRTDSMMRGAGWEGMSGVTAYDAYLPEMNIYTDRYGTEPRLGRMAMVGRKLNIFTGGQERVDRAFAQKSNSEDTHYATGYYDSQVGGPEAHNRYSTELISTTAELFASKTNADYLMRTDPARAAFFLYTANRPLYDEVKEEFYTLLREEDMPPSITLGRLIHVN